jgi:hypothetical protein
MAAAIPPGRNKGPNDMTTTEKSRAVSERTYINTEGAESDLDSATGVNYKWLADGRDYTYTFGENEEADRMLAVFGAATLAGNVASTWANTKGGDRADSPVDDIEARFTALAEGKWLVEGRRAPSIDLDTLAQAVVQVLALKGKTVTLESARAKLDDKAIVAQTRANTEIWGIYQKLRGRATTVEAISDLF